MLRTIAHRVRSKFSKVVIVPKQNNFNEIKAPILNLRKHRDVEDPSYIPVSSHQIVFEPFLKIVFPIASTKTPYPEMSEIDPDGVLKPLRCVKGMTKLDRSAFDSLATVLGVRIPVNKIGQILKRMKKFQLKMPTVKTVVELEKTDPEYNTHRLVLVDPKEARTYDSLPERIRDMLTDNDITSSDFRDYKLKLTYSNWNLSDILRAVIPDDVEAVSGYSEVGHIAHFNLRNEVLPYKQLIGEVLLDKQPNIRTAVNKLNVIDSTYRNFSMELLAGEDNYVTQTKENGCIFELDFSKVYWNSRLGTEHERIVKKVSSGDVVFDVFGGIGPFSVPSAKKRATVFANDLNPASYDSLVQNTKLNKLKDNIKCYNLDGREFITSVVKEELIKIYQQENEFPLQETSSIHILMNLPALAWTFLDAYHFLLPSSVVIPENLALPVVNCYCFTDYDTATEKFDGDMTEEVRQRIAGIVEGLDVEQVSARYVRNVSPRKDMMCVMFTLTRQILCVPIAAGGEQEQSSKDSDEPPAKCQKMD